MRIAKIIFGFADKQAAKRTAKVIERKEAQIAKYFQIHNRSNADFVLEQIYPMREAVANYAKAHNVRIDLYELNSLRPNQSTLNLSIERLNYPLRRNHIITEFNIEDIEKTYKNTIRIKNKKPKYDSTIEREHNFLSNFFRTIEDLVNELQ